MGGLKFWVPTVFEVLKFGSLRYGYPIGANAGQALFRRHGTVKLLHAIKSVSRSGSASVLNNEASDGCETTTCVKHGSQQVCPRIMAPLLMLLSNGYRQPGSNVKVDLCSEQQDSPDAVMHTSKTRAM